MEVRLFRTEMGVVFYYYLGIQSISDLSCHVWELVLQMEDGSLLCGRTCFQVGSPICIDAIEAASDAAALLNEHRRMRGFLSEE